MLASQVSVKPNKIKVESGTGKEKIYETRKWCGDYNPNIASATSPREGFVYQHLRFEDNVPVVREVNVSEILRANQKLIVQ
jgi:hypothetical protein